jgi:hypothetical protein
MEKRHMRERLYPVVYIIILRWASLGNMVFLMLRVTSKES